MLSVAATTNSTHQDNLSTDQGVLASQAVLGWLELDQYSFTCEK